MHSLIRENTKYLKACSRAATAFALLITLTAAVLICWHMFGSKDPAEPQTAITPMLLDTALPITMAVVLATTAASLLGYLASEITSPPAILKIAPLILTIMAALLTVKIVYQLATLEMPPVPPPAISESGDSETPPFILNYIRTWLTILPSILILALQAFALTAAAKLLKIFTPREKQN